MRVYGGSHKAYEMREERNETARAVVMYSGRMSLWVLIMAATEAADRQQLVGGRTIMRLRSKGQTAGLRDRSKSRVWGHKVWSNRTEAIRQG